MIEVNEGWQERATAICQPRNFSVEVAANEQYLLVAGLTDDELTRLEPKLELVRELAMRLAINMAKGTIKYPCDTWSVDNWLAAAVDDTADGLNYIMMLRGAIDVERAGQTAYVKCNSTCDQECKELKEYKEDHKYDNWGSCE